MGWEAGRNGPGSSSADHSIFIGTKTGGNVTLVGVEQIRLNATGTAMPVLTNSSGDTKGFYVKPVLGGNAVGNVVLDGGLHTVKRPAKSSDWWPLAYNSHTGEVGYYDPN